MNDAIQLMGLAAKASAECSVAMSIANKAAAKAADAYEAAAKAQEALSLDATAYWTNAALFRGIEKNGKEMNFEGLISMYLEFAEVCS